VGALLFALRKETGLTSLTSLLLNTAAQTLIHLNGIVDLRRYGGRTVQEASDGARQNPVG
jgi:hypothetical protein